jgi:putative ABC transport system permease protein
MKVYIRRRKPAPRSTSNWFSESVQAIQQDARFGVRILLRSPGLTSLVVLALALGIGANSAMFSVVDALLLHPLSYERPEELTIVFDRDTRGQLRSASAGNFIDWRKAKSFTGLAGWAPSVYVLSGEQPVQVLGARVTANIFQVLGVKPFMGRTFLIGEDGLDGSATVSRVAVISYGLWQDALASDPNVLGREIRLNDNKFAIIGVMRSDFELFNRRHQIWVPAVLDGANRDYHYLQVVGRRKVSLGETRGEMVSLSRSLAEAYPEDNRGRVAQVESFEEWLVDRPVRTRLLLLLAAVGLVLLLACSNVASLLLARSASRSREIALRVSLGATRGRIVGQLLIESLLLSLTGGLLGLMLAGALIQAAPSFVPASAIPTTAPLTLSLSVIGFTLAVSLLTGVLFGLAPAVASSKPDVQEALQDTARGSTGGRGRQFFRQAMVTIEVAVALVLLSSATLMVSSLQRLAATDLGLNINNVLTQRIFLPAASYDAARALRFQRQAMEQVAAIPGVAQVAMGSNLPLSRMGMQVPFDLESAPVRATGEMPGAGYTTVTPGFFSLLKVPVRAGREFDVNDSENAPGVAMVNVAFADRFFPNGNALGQRLRVNKPALGKNGFGSTEYVQIVGVVGNVTLEEIGASPLATIYAPLAQNVWSTAHWMTIKTSGDPARLAPSVRRAIMAMDTSQPLDSATSLAGSLAVQFAEPQFQSRLMGGFALLALGLAIVGIYGVNSYAVSQRQREIGVRLALGATGGSILRDILGRGMKLTAVGIVVGLAGAVGMNSVLRSALLDVGGVEVGPMLSAAAVLTAVAAAACYLPARRATQIDPAITLRKE